MANMFGALNRFMSRLDADPNVHTSHQSSSPGFGFQVLRNNQNIIPLEPWFDFIIGINGRTIDNPDPQLFATEVRNCTGSSISLGVFSAKGQTIRETFIEIPKDNPSLGISLQWCPLATVNEVWHILDVMPNSPADVAGLLPYSDYVIGSPESVQLVGEASLGNLVEQFTKRPLRLWVYNHEYNVTRMVTITPAKDWGGEGSLGCMLGYGALHRVPALLTEPAQGPGETLFDGNGVGGDAVSHQTGGPAASSQSGSQQEFLVPANLQFTDTKSLQKAPPPPSAGTRGGPPSAGKARKAKQHAAPAAGLDDYFAEGEQKSREIEGGRSTPTTNSSLPPPPKAGAGPPKAASPAPPEDTTASPENAHGS